MNQEGEQPEVEVTTGRDAGPGETPPGDAAESAAGVTPWAVESETLLNKLGAHDGWIQWERIGYAVFKISLRQPDGESGELLLLCLTGNKLREALASLRGVVRSKLFDELCERQEEADKVRAQRESEKARKQDESKNTTTRS